MVKWTPESEKDLEQILEHISDNFNVDLAIETVNEIVDQVASILTANPLAGSLLESNPLFSKRVIQGNSVFYCENPKDRHLYVVYVQGRNSSLKDERLKGI